MIFLVYMHAYLLQLVPCGEVLPFVLESVLPLHDAHAPHFLTCYGVLVHTKMFEVFLKRNIFTSNVEKKKHPNLDYLRACEPKRSSSQ